MSVEVQRALDYSQKEVSAGEYTLRIVNPENGQPTIALNSTVQTDFLLPNKVVNMARSFLEFDYTIPAGGVGAYNVIHNGALSEIDGIVLSTASGVRLVDENYVPYKTKLCWRAETPLEEFLTFNPHTTAVVAETTVAGVFEMGQKFHSGKVANDVTAAAGAGGGSTYVSAIAGTTLAAGSDSYTGVNNFLFASAADAVKAVRVKLPLKMIYGSLLALDKDLYFNEQLRLTIRWNAGSYWAATSTAVANAFAAPTAIATAPTVSNCRLRVAVETNPSVSSALVSRVMSGEGINIKMPFTYAYKALSSATANDSNSVIRKLNRGHGERCLRIYAGVFFPTQTDTRYLQNYNATGTPATALLWQSWRPYLDSKPLTDNSLEHGDFTAYEYQSELMRGSVIKGAKDWQQSGPMIVNFSGIPRSKDFPKNDDKVSGLDLSVEREFSLEWENVQASATPIYMFAVCQKNLNISPQGIAVL